MNVPHPRYSHILITVNPPPNPARQSMAGNERRMPRRRNPLEYDSYGTNVGALINLIGRQPTGRIVLQTIQSTGRTMRILPFQPTVQDPLNAYAGPESIEDATPRGQRALQCGGRQTGQPIREGLLGWSIEGTGRGSHVLIHFSSWMWASPPGFAPQVGPLAGPGSRADEVLFHEMVHGFRQMAGHLLCSAAGMRNYDTFEEYFAIVVTNMYMSESSGQTNTPLRAHHQGFTRLPFASLFPDERVNQERLRRIQQQHPGLTTELALHGTGAFNPFRDLFLQTQPLPRGPAHA